MPANVAAPGRMCAILIAVAALVWAYAGAASAASLPDGRAYEMVSPVAKKGAEVMGASSRTRAAATEDAQHPMAATFSSLAGFGEVHGTGVAIDYMSERDGRPGTSGWSTHAITPPQDPLSILGVFRALDPLYEGDFSPDLTTGIFRAWSPLTNVPDVSSVENLYERNDLRTPGRGSYKLLSACPACATTGALPPGVDKPKLADTSADFSHVIFESPNPLTAEGTTGSPNLYESDHGAIQLAGILPDGTPASSSAAGQGATSLHYTHNTISRDGSRVFFTGPVQANGNVNTDVGATASQIYMRDLQTHTTVQVSKSERSSPDPSQPATFWTASTDGSRVFFTSGEALTDNAPVSSNNPHLYMWDANAPLGHRLTLLDVDMNPGDASGPVLGVIGAGDDGVHVYFSAAGQLVAGAPVLNSDVGVYMWSEGQIAYVGRLANGADALAYNLNLDWNANPVQSRVTPDGKLLLLAASNGAGLTGYDQNGCGATCLELYTYGAESHHLACASCDPTGAPPTGSASTNVQEIGTGGSLGTWHQSRALVSADGGLVFFSTSDSLVPEDTNDKVDAYEYHVATGTLSLLSSGKDKSDSYFMDASADGHDVFFMTRQQLVGWDTDPSYDLYDARVGGGFPNPPTTLAACAGDACQGALSTSPPRPSAGSTSIAGPGNVVSRTPPKSKGRPKAKPRPKCKRGFVRKKVKGKLRCVKKPRATKHVKRASTRRMAK